MANAQQKALFVHELGKPIQLGTRAIPSSMEGQVLVQVDSTMLLPHDMKARDMGLFIGDKLPFILGANVAGTVKQLGDNVTGLNIGDAVFGLSDFLGPTPDQSGLQEYAILNADGIAKVPPGISSDEAATLPINIVTSWIALFGTTGLGFPAPFSPESHTFDYAAQTLVIYAAGASVGKFAVQLASMAGIGTIIAIAGPETQTALLDMGATHVVDRHLAPDELVRRVHAVTGDEGVTHLYHCHGRDWSVDTALLAREKPTVLRSVHRMTAEQAAQIRKERPSSDVAFVQCSHENLRPYAREFWTRLPVWLEEGKVRPGGFRVIEGLENVEEINRALDEYRTGSAVQVIVHP